MDKVFLVTPFSRMCIRINILVAGLVVAMAGSVQSAFVVDSFREPPGAGQNTVISGSNNQPDDIYVTGLSTQETVGGARYYIVQNQSGAGTVRSFTDGAPIGQFSYISSAQGLGFGQLSYGFDGVNTVALNADFIQNGLIFGFTLKEFFATTDALDGSISLTVHSETGTGTVAKVIGDFVNNPEWLHSEYDGQNVNFANVQRLDLAWGGFSSPGADIDFTFFATANHLPEPGTMVLLTSAIGAIAALRRRRQRHDFVPVSTPPNAGHAPSDTDLYARPFRG